MPEYRVTWVIDLDAASFQRAAEKALAIQRNPESIATVFCVRALPLVPGAPKITIDLTEDTATCVHCGRCIASSDTLWYHLDNGLAPCNPADVDPEALSDCEGDKYHIATPPEPTDLRLPEREDFDADDSCPKCGAALGPTNECPWHYWDEDCRAIRTPQATS